MVHFEVFIHVSKPPRVHDFSLTVPTLVLRLASPNTSSREAWAMERTLPWLLESRGYGFECAFLFGEQGGIQRRIMA